MTIFRFERIKRALNPLVRGFKKGYVITHLKTMLALLRVHTIHFLRALDSHQRLLSQMGEKNLEKLYATTKGLHALLPSNPLFTYSILIEVDPNTKLEQLQSTIHACLKQTAPSYEILIGYKSHEIQKQNFSEQCRFIFCENEIFNDLAEEAKGNYLILVKAGDWLRPDLLFRYEQTLRLLPSPEKTVLTCNEFLINRQDRYIAGSEIVKPDHYSFPYVFVDDFYSHFLIPSKLWKTIKGLRQEFKSHQYYDLILRLDTIGAKVHTVPFFLYAHPKQTHPSKSTLGIEALAEYVQAKNLSWKIVEGLYPNSYRAIPELKAVPNVQVIIPFKDQKELTLKTVHSVLGQKGVQTYITALDNNSNDASISESLQSLGVEVIKVSEPFNFSRLNNLAVKNTATAKHCEYLLFLNNDVELNADALLEMSRWAAQPQVGIVGCRLHYPNGLVQHGGIDLTAMGWENTATGKPLQSSRSAQTLRVSHAVTAACALMKRKTFDEIQGFDEIWYPIAYSDTHLAVKVQAKGLLCLYTPFATGIHYESQSRNLQHIEDFESSLWLHDKITK